MIPWILALGPVSLLLGRVPSRWPIVPGSAISFWDHKPGNIAVHVSIALAFLWLVPGTNRRTRALLTGFATVVLLMVAKNRGLVVRRRPRGPVASRGEGGQVCNAGTSGCCSRSSGERTFT